MTRAETGPSSLAHGKEGERAHVLQRSQRKQVPWVVANQLSTAPRGKKRRATPHASAESVKPLTEDELDALACVEIDRRLRTDDEIPLGEILKEYGRRPRVVGR